MKTHNYCVNLHQKASHIFYCRRQELSRGVIVFFLHNLHCWLSPLPRPFLFGASTETTHKIRNFYLSTL